MFLLCCRNTILSYDLLQDNPFFAFSSSTAVVASEIGSSDRRMKIPLDLSEFCSSTLAWTSTTFQSLRVSWRILGMQPTMTPMQSSMKAHMIALTASDSVIVRETPSNWFVESFTCTLFPRLEWHQEVESHNTSNRETKCQLVYQPHTPTVREDQQYAHTEHGYHTSLLP